MPSRVQLTPRESPVTRDEWLIRLRRPERTRLSRRFRQFVRTLGSVFRKGS